MKQSVRDEGGKGRRRGVGLGVVALWFALAAAAWGETVTVAPCVRDAAVEAAKILDKYWPSKLIEINDDGAGRFIETGHNVYRIGGDEFVLLTIADNIDVVKKKAHQASSEAKKILLGIEDELPVGLNYGIVEHSKGSVIKETFIKADEMLSEDKKRMYQKYGLDRRC